MATSEVASRPAQLLTVREVARLCKVSVRQVWRLVAQGDLPEPIRLGAKSVRWREADIAARLARQG